MRPSLRISIRVVHTACLLAVVSLVPALARAQSLPTGWAVADVGRPRLTGTASFVNGVFTVTGAGASEPRLDQLTYAFRQMSGDGVFIARVDAIQRATSAARVGVMMRASLSGDSRMVFLNLDATGGLRLAYRATTSNASWTDRRTGRPDAWLKLERRGSRVTASWSSDAAAWTAVGQVDVALPSNVFVGVGVTSGESRRIVTASFSGTGATGGGSSVPQNQPPSVSLTSPASGTYAAPATLTLAANASDPENALAQVSFYAGTTLLGTDTTAPYTLAWSGVAAGSYVLTAVAQDRGGQTTTSAGVNVSVTSPPPSETNQPPTVSLVSPRDSAQLPAPATLTVSANAADADGTIARVEFYANTTLVGTDTTSPYSVVWSNVPAGRYMMTAVAIDNRGGRTTSAGNRLAVTGGNQAPTVSLSAPTDGASTTAPGTLTIAAVAGDADGTVARVEFYANTTLVGTDASSPYAMTWSNVAAGSYTITAVAVDNAGARTTSTGSRVSVTAATNQSPVVSLSSPGDGAAFLAPATVSLTASASDADGTIARVDFYAGETRIGSDTAAPYAMSWTSVTAGTYALRAMAIDNAGASTVSAVRSITVTDPALPSSATWVPSVNHDTAVDRYVIEFFAQGADPELSNPVATRDAGKPAVVAGECRAAVSDMVAALPAGTYFATVTAIGPDGEARSAPSMTFTR